MTHKTINIAPVPAARPRVTAKGVYYPPAYDGYRKALPLLLRGLELYTEPIYVGLVFSIPMPKSWTQKKRAAKAGQYHDSRPDIDNYVKGALDAMNGVLFLDDAQVAVIRAKKIWSYNGSIELSINRL